MSLMLDAIKEGNKIDNEEAVIKGFIASNPEFFHVYSILGQYFHMSGNNDEAIKYYNLALTKELSSATEREKIVQKLDECRDER